MKQPTLTLVVWTACVVFTFVSRRQTPFSPDFPLFFYFPFYLGQGCQTHFGVGPHWMKCDFMGAGKMQTACHDTVEF